GAQETPLVEEVVGRLLQLVAYAHDRHLARRAQPEVANVEQEVDAVFFWLDRIIQRARSDQRELRDAEFDAARRARIGLHLAAHRERTLKREVLESLPGLGADLRLHDDALQEARAIAHGHEGDLAG